MALAIKRFTVTDFQGNVLPGATVTVRMERPGAPLAALYSDREGLVPKTNPFDADGDGVVEFYAVGGAYRIDISSGDYNATLRYVAVGTASEYDAGEYGGQLIAVPTVEDFATVLKDTILIDQPGFQSAIFGPSVLKGLRIFTSSGTYVPDDDVRAILAIVTGGGGGGGGADGLDTSSRTAGGGGGSGATSLGFFTKSQMSSSHSITVGSGGLGGSSNGGDGGGGGSSLIGGLEISAGGGNGGEGAASDGSLPGQGGKGGNPGSGGQLHLGGGDGHDAIVLISTDAAFGGNGGSSFWGGAGLGTGIWNPPGSIAGNPGWANTGGGGGGAACMHTTSGRAGGDGGSGVVVILEAK